MKLLSERHSSRALVLQLLAFLACSAVVLLVIPYKNYIASQLSGISIRSCCSFSVLRPADSSLEQRGTSTAVTAARGGSSAPHNQQPQLQLEFNCSTDAFTNNTSCALADASRYFVCNKRYPRTGAFVAGSSDWRAFGNCALKPCLFQQQQQQQQPSNVSALVAKAATNSSAGLRRLRQAQQQQQDRTQYIVILGDSQGMHYTEAVVRGLRATGASCTVQKRESSASYFGDPAGIVYRKQDCSGCSSSLTRCIHPSTQVNLRIGCKGKAATHTLHELQLYRAAVIRKCMQLALGRMGN
jgi:hypothetical protein